MVSIKSNLTRHETDYADSHKNDQWQSFAAACAAAFTKELLTYTRVVDVQQARAAREILGNIQTDISEIKTSLDDNLLGTRVLEHSKRVLGILQALYTCPYAERKNRNIERLEGTCEWFTKHHLFNHWRNTEGSSLLWVSADPGCGKSVLTRYLVDVILPSSKDGSEKGTESPARTVCYFFFKDEFTDQKSSANALCSILRQLLQQNSNLVRTEILDQFASEGSKYTESFQSLWDNFLTASLDPAAGEVICVLDALDECQIQDCRQLIEAICNLYDNGGPRGKLKFLVTSRPYSHIQDIFQDLKDKIPTIHLQGENEEEVRSISGEIDLVINHRIQRLGRRRNLTTDETSLLSQKFASVPHRTYLWAHLTLSFLEQAIILNKDSIDRILDDLPASVDQAYDKILSRSTDKEKSKLILEAIVAAVRPLTLEEMPVVLAITMEHVGSKKLANSLEPVERCSTTIRNLCGLFVVLVDRRVYLLHQTAREFLLQSGTVSQALTRPTGSNRPSMDSRADSVLVWKGCVKMPKANRMLAERCLWYLSQSQHEDFLEYSTEHWMKHFRESDISDEAEITQLALQLCDYWSGNGYDNWQSIDKPPRKVLSSSLLMLPAFLGLTPVVKKLLVSKLGQKSTIEDKSRALWLASSRGFTEVVRLLLSIGGHVNTDINGQALQLESVSSFGKSSVYGTPSTSSTVSAQHKSLGLGRSFGSSLFRKIRNERRGDSSPSSSQSSMPSTRNQSPNSSVFRNIAQSLKTTTPLHLAARVGNVGLTELLIDNGADVHICDESGDTPLQVAAIPYHRDVIELLLKHGAERKTENLSGFTPLQSFYHDHRGQCSASRAADVFKLLYDTSSPINQRFDHKKTMLHTVAVHNCTHCARVLLLNKAAVEQRNGAEETLLHYAQVMDSLEMVQLITRYQIPMDLICSNGLTPLIRAIKRNSLTAIWNLLKFGANPNMADRDGLTPLMHAGIMGYEVSGVSVVSILLASRVRVDDVDDFGNSCLHHALQGKNIKNLEAVLARGADVNWQNAEGLSPLMLLCSRIRWKFDYRRAAVTLLLQRGAKIELKDKDGRTALSHCKELATVWGSKWTGNTGRDWYGFFDTVKMLEDWGAKE